MKDLKCSTQQKDSIQDVIKQAWYDISMLMHAVESWPTGDGDYVPEYLLLLMTAQYSRGRSALSFLGHLGSKYQNEIDELTEEYSSGEKHFIKILQEDKGKIENLFREGRGLAVRLDALEKQFGEIYDIVENRVFADDTDQGEYLEDIGEEFLLVFYDMARLALDAPKELVNHSTFKHWQKRFLRLKTRYEVNISNFSSFADYIQNIKSIEYADQKFSWLHTLPEKEQHIEPVFTDEQLRALGNFYLSPPAEPLKKEPCPDTELVIAYAFADPISEQNVGLVKNHIITCRHCLDIVLDVRAADADAMDNTRVDDKGVTKKEFDEIVSNIPVWRIAPDMSTVVTRAQIPDNTDIPDFMLGGVYNTILASAPVPSAYSQHSSNDDEIFAKIVIPKEALPVAFYYVLLQIEGSDYNSGKLSFICTLQGSTPEPDAVFHCFWRHKTTSKVTKAETVECKDATVLITFDFDETEQKPDGDLFVLVEQQKKE